MRVNTLIFVGFLFVPIILTAQDSWDELVNDVAVIRTELLDAKSDEARANPAERLGNLMNRVIHHPDVLDRSQAPIPISSVMPEDGKFRLFTWNIPSDNGKQRYYGLMALKGKKGNSVVQFRDSTSVLEGNINRELFPGKWYGALYYDVITTKRGGKRFYTLLGWKGFNRTETQKVLEVMSFAGTRVKLGAPIFEASPASKKKDYRQCYRYSFQAKMNLDIDREGERIVMDHLAPSRADLKGQFSFYGPDLSYDAFQWDGRNWVFERDIDVKGNAGEKKLWNKPETPNLNKVK
jgi:hypothetical protein